MNYGEIIQTITTWHDTGSQISKWDQQLAADIKNRLVELYEAQWPESRKSSYRFDGIDSLPTDALAVLHLAIFDREATDA